MLKAKYRKKPVVIEAIQLVEGNFSEVHSFLLEHNAEVNVEPGKISIMTLEGEMLVSLGDYVICGVKGELYPCKPDIFEATYERV